MHMGTFHKRACGNLFGKHLIRHFDGQAAVERNVDVADLIAVDMPDLIHGRLGTPFLWAIIFERLIDNPDILTIEDLGRFGVDRFVDCKQGNVRLARRPDERVPVPSGMRIDGPHNKTQLENGITDLSRESSEMRWHVGRLMTIC